MNWRTQFAKPTGAMGWMVGHLMAMKNGERSEWIFSLLELGPDDRVLEIGFGPGVDIARASGIAKFVAGVDHSDVMVRQATRRNGPAIREGRVELRHGVAAQLPSCLPAIGAPFETSHPRQSVACPRGMGVVLENLRPGS